MRKQKAIYILGAGPLGLKVIEWACELGLNTIVSDRNQHASGRHLADHFVHADAAGKDDHLNAIKKYLEVYDIVGAFCGNEVGVLSVYSINKALSIENNSKKALGIVLDKKLMKSRWENDGINAPQTLLIRDEKELKSFLNENEGRYILKPSLGSGSRGVHLVKQGTDLESIFEEVLKPVGGMGTVIIEPYIEGRSIDTNGLFMNGKFFPTGVLEKYITDPPDCLPLGGFDPVELTLNEETELFNLFEEACRSIGLNAGPVKGDFIKTKEGFVVLEVAPRLHGDVTTCNTLPHGSGINPVKAYFQFLKSGEIDDSYLSQTKQRYGIWRVLCLPPGKIAKIIKPDEKNYIGVTKVWLNPRTRHEIKPYKNTVQIPGYICGYGRDKNEAEQRMESYFQDFNIEVEPTTKYLKWYNNLGHKLDQLGFSRKSCGYQDKYN